MRVLWIILLIAGTATATPKKSPYVDQVDHQIKALTPDDLAGLQAGSGTPFGGMAKAAELNGYPGPKHILELKKELKLTEAQEKRIQQIFQQMNQAAKALGRELIAAESALDKKLKDGSINASLVRTVTNASARAYGNLRATHLIAHLEAKKVLTQEQNESYQQLRGYTKADPCQHIPPGHPPELWKKHHGCK